MTPTDNYLSWSSRIIVERNIIVNMNRYNKRTSSIHQWFLLLLIYLYILNSIFFCLFLILTSLTCLTILVCPPSDCWTHQERSLMCNYSRLTFHGERERNVLFNDALNTFYLRLYGVRHMVKDHSDSEKGNPLPPHRLLLSINSKGSFICTIPHRITHTTDFFIPVVEHWLEREITFHGYSSQFQD